MSDECMVYDMASSCSHKRICIDALNSQTTGELAESHCSFRKRNILVEERQISSKDVSNYLRIDVA